MPRNWNWVVGRRDGWVPLAKAVAELEAKACPRCDSFYNVNSREARLARVCNCAKYCGTANCEGAKPQPDYDGPEDGWAQADDAWRED